MNPWFSRLSSSFLLCTLGLTTPVSMSIAAEPTGTLATSSDVAKATSSVQPPSSTSENQQPAEPSSPNVPAGTEAASPTQAEQANQLSQDAVVKFQAKDYQGAVDLFNQAYSLDSNPNYLFNIGRVYEESGDIEHSVEYYQRFVNAPGVELESRSLAVKRLEVLNQILKNRKSEEKVEPKPQTPIDAPKVDEKEPKKPGRVLGIAGYSLLGVGAGALITGGVLAGLSQNKEKSLGNATTYEESDKLIQTGKTYASVANGMFIGGGVLAVVGLSLVIASLAKNHKSHKVAWQPHWGSKNTFGVGIRF